MEQGFFQGFLLGPFLQRRLSLAEQLGVCGGRLPVNDVCNNDIFQQHELEDFLRRGYYLSKKSKSARRGHCNSSL